MREDLANIRFQPIGIVHSEIKKRSRQYDKKVVSEIQINSDLTEALDNLDEFSHIIVIYYIHQSRQPVPMKVHPRHTENRSPVGVFASRSPDRPNPIGKSVVRLLERRGNVLVVEGLDAIDGSPVLDLKPYIPGLDSADDATVPPWMTKH
jgi:tRNA-Thr(GGU) m(6)t(6)A37 methyltransferase TsaA